MQELIAPTVNLAILIAALVYFLRAPLKDFIQNRHTTVRDELARVRELLQKARSQHAEFSAKLNAMGAEVASYRDQAKEDAQAMKQRIVSEAQRLSGNIVGDSRTAAAGLYSELKGQLRSEMAGKVMIRAEKVLRDRLTANDRERIRQEFSTQVERVQ
jgi:F0F1-type ATP synthase membrane subunit b/b'